MHTHASIPFSFTQFACVCHEIWNAVSLIMECACSIWGGRYLSFFSYTQLHAYMIPISSYAKLTFLWMSHNHRSVGLSASSRLVFVIQPLVVSLSFCSVVVLFVCSIPSSSSASVAERKKKYTNNCGSFAFLRSASKNIPVCTTPLPLSTDIFR